MRTARQRFFDLADLHGISVDYSEGRKRHPRTGEPVAWEMTLDAPMGLAFVSSGCSVDCSLFGDEGCVTPDWDKALVALQEIVSLGFEDDLEGGFTEALEKDD